MRQAWFDTNRVVLGKAVPLDTPLSITLTPSSICNFKCKYCMQSADKSVIAKKGFKTQLMPWETFALCIEQLKAFPRPLKKLEFYGMGEPLCNPRLPEMIAHARKASVCGSTSLMTNGSLLTRKLSDSLIDAGIDEIKISLQGLSSAQYKETSGAALDFDKFVSEIAYLNGIKGKTRLYVKIIETALLKEDRGSGKFEKTFSGICDRFSVERLLPLFNDVDFDATASKANADGSFSARYGEARRRRKICHFPFFRLIILADGKATSCCDPLNAVYFGSVEKTSLLDIWNSKRRLKFLLEQVSGKSAAVAPCKDCYMPNDIYSEADDLEPYAEEIFSRLQ